MKLSLDNETEEYAGSFVLWMSCGMLRNKGDVL